MIRLFGRPDRVALAMIAALERGDLRTPGAWIDWIRHYERLPCGLQNWTLQRIKEIAGDETCDYLISRIELPETGAAA